MISTSEENSPKREYNTKYRKNLANKIKLINNTQHYIQLFNIIKTDKNNNYSTNSNGIWIDLNILEDKTIVKIKNFLDSIISLDHNNNYTYKYKPYIENIFDTIGPKLSNHEKSLIKRIHLADQDN